MSEANPIAYLVRELLDELDSLSTQHEELGDTDVRESLRELLHDHLFEPKSDATWPSQLGMFSPEADSALLSVMRRFVTKARATFEERSMVAPGDRVALFQDGKVSSLNGSYYDDYFGEESP